MTEEEWDALFLQYRNDALSYAIHFYGGGPVSEDELFTQAERFFDFIMGEKPKKKKPRVIKLVKKQGECISEGSMWGRVRKALKGLDPVRIENKCELGTPDVNISTGAWVELKIGYTPKRGGNLFIIEHWHYFIPI